MVLLMAQVFLDLIATRLSTTRIWRSGCTDACALWSSATPNT